MKPDTMPTKDERNEALAKVVASNAMRNSDRAIQFLRYVVEESIAGRAKGIRGKTIAADVFGRDPAETDSDNVVRVEARRVRRKLDDYYREEGLDDPIRIHLDAGGYIPRFEQRAATETPTTTVKNSFGTSLKLAAVVGALAVVALAMLLTLSDISLTRPPHAAMDSENSINERKALREKSLASLEAANLDLQGRDLRFPVLDPGRQKLALSLFNEAIELDPTYFGSFASAAHTLGTLALLTPENAEKENLLNSAQAMADRAVELAPQEGWTQAGQAWVSFARRDFDDAIRLAELAVELDRNNGNVLDTYGFIMFVSGRFADSAAATAPERSFDESGQRLGRKNIFGVASFHLGNYQDAISSFQKAIEQGDPVSAPTLVFFAASYARLGNIEKAQEHFFELSQTYPNFRPEIVFPTFYRNPSDADDVLEALEIAGWRQG